MKDKILQKIKRVFQKLRQRDFALFVLLIVSGILLFGSGYQLQSATNTDVDYSLFGIILVVLAILIMYGRSRGR